MGKLQHLPSSAAAARRRMVAPPSSSRFDAIHVDAVGRLARELLDRRSSAVVSRAGVAGRGASATAPPGSGRSSG